MQTYLRDPAGNLLELDTPFASRLPASLRRNIRPISELRPQSDENRRARLNLASGADRRANGTSSRSSGLSRSIASSSMVLSVQFARRFLESGQA